ncbi:MAG TPA: hypothetical protein VLG49_01500 [Rhabdochlamydiaceae bacterium]|nr:hypothetical protein [Rhabdochlamydiaceae bacterium]
MIQQILELTSRLSQFENRLHHFEEMVPQIAKGAYSDSQIEVAKFEYEQVYTETQNLREIRKTVDVSMEAFSIAVIAQFDGLIKSYNDLTEKFDRSLNAHEIHPKLNALYEQFLVLGLSKKTAEMDTLKRRNLEIVSSKMTPVQLETAINLHNQIESYQISKVGESLRQVHHLINKAMNYPEDHRQQFYDSIDDIFTDLCSFELGRAVTNDIFQKIKDKTGVDAQNFDEIDHLLFEIVSPHLFEILSSHPLYKPDVMEPEVLSESSSDDEEFLSESGQETSDGGMGTSMDVGSDGIPSHASETPQKEQTEDNLPILDMIWGGSIVEVPPRAPSPGFEGNSAVGEAQLVDFNPVIIQLDLLTFSTLVREIVNNQNLSKEACIAAIDQLRYQLPEQVRWDLDGRVYEFSKDPHKGGENWGSKNAAKDPNLLLEAIDAELNKKNL